MCPFCNQYEDTQNHLLECPELLKNDTIVSCEQEQKYNMLASDSGNECL